VCVCADMQDYTYSKVPPCPNISLECASRLVTGCNWTRTRRQLGVSHIFPKLPKYRLQLTALATDWDAHPSMKSRATLEPHPISWTGPHPAFWAKCAPRWCRAPANVLGELMLPQNDLSPNRTFRNIQENKRSFAMSCATVSNITTRTSA
jgi:hypothetical protein